MPLFHQYRGDCEQNELEIAKDVQRAKTFGQLCATFGYAHEEHVVTTDDGYILLLQRLLPKGTRFASESRQRPVVYFQHGLLTNSELFMRVTDVKKCLPLVLVDSGYDVWLGNNRLVRSINYHAFIFLT